MKECSIDITLSNKIINCPIHIESIELSLVYKEPKGYLTIKKITIVESHPTFDNPVLKKLELQLFLNNRSIYYFNLGHEKNDDYRVQSSMNSWFHNDNIAYSHDIMEIIFNKNNHFLSSPLDSDDEIKYSLKYTDFKGSYSFNGTTNITEVDRKATP